jgi:sortase A
LTPTIVNEPATNSGVLVPPDRIVVPSIGLDVAIAPVGWSVVEEGGAQRSAWNVPLDAAGWHQNSAMPGEDGNVVLSGHHNLGAQVFRHLVELHVGDEIVLDTGGVLHRYAVTERFILPERGVPEAQRQQNALWIAPTKRERLTLVTCWPYTDNSHRVIVVAAPIENDSRSDYGG